MGGRKNAFSNVVLQEWLNKAGEHKDFAIISGGVAVTSLVAVQLFTSANPLGRCYTFWKQLRGHESRLSCNTSVKKGIDDYSDLHRGKDVDERNSQYKELVNAYYDLATVFYEWGWGSCFHFSYRLAHETFWEAIRRHEYQLVSHLNVNISASTTQNGSPPPTKKLLDVGCGIGGPMRNIARFTGLNITGITLNPYQVDRGNELNKKEGLEKQCRSVQGDFMETPFDSNSFDGAYAIEATCHAPDRVKCYGEVLRVLKPGAYFACYEWCMTDQYDPSNPEHQVFKKNIEEGNGLPDIINTHDCWQALQAAGFEPILEQDLATVTTNVKDTWYTPLLPSWNPLSQRFQFNPVGGVLTNQAIWFMEFIGLAPKGTVKTQKILQAGGFALRDAGKEGVFTAMYLMVGRKPLTA